MRARSPRVSPISVEPEIKPILRTYNRLIAYVGLIRQKDATNHNLPAEEGMHDRFRHTQVYFADLAFVGQIITVCSTRRTLREEMGGGESLLPGNQRDRAGIASPSTQNKGNGW